ncbi:photosystem II protein PsbW class I [Calothrix sp. PCC 7507]|nr:photosystem II protein PsbW class I [Calothrix sp. PCC 7507]
MESITPSIQFFAGVFEDLRNVSLRREVRTGKRLVLLIFNQLLALVVFGSAGRKARVSETLTLQSLISTLTDY